MACGILVTMLQSTWMRLGRFIFALLAIWCLGCNSFEMLAGTLRAGSMVACSERSGSTDASPADGARLSAATSNVLSAVDQGCGCDHCVGTEVIVAGVSPVEGLMPESFNLIAQFPAKVSTAPSVPPPELPAAV